MRKKIMPAATSVPPDEAVRLATPCPAAQYLRMSTEHQQYSLANQMAALGEYASKHGFTIVRTYSDAARSGVSLKSRTGLSNLLHDVTSGNVNYRAVLVYDISRWGRFQDVDEAAHYEFICKTSGVRIYYCAEPFPNDDSLPSAILKNLKRSMAGEYSRELGVKVYAGKKRLALIGYRMGGAPGYGLQRLLVSADGRRRQFLLPHQYKYTSTDRVILVPGPKKEVQWVRRIFHMFLCEDKNMREIADSLNQARITNRYGRRWSYDSIRKMLMHPKYAGTNVWGQTENRLQRPVRTIPRDTWITKQNCFIPIISPDVFAKVQEKLVHPTTITNEYLLEKLRLLLKRKGRLSQRIMQRAAGPGGIPSTHTYYERFGTLESVYNLVGFKPAPGTFKRIGPRKCMTALRERLFREIVNSHPDRLCVYRLHPGARPILRVDGTLRVSVLMCRCRRISTGELRWDLPMVSDERRFVTLLCLLNAENDGFFRLYLFPRADKPRPFRFAADDPWFRFGQRLGKISDFYAAVRHFASQ